MKNCKRFLACLLCAIMLMSVLPVSSVFANSYILSSLEANAESYTYNEVLAAKLQEIFNGDIDIYTDYKCTNEKSLPLGCDMNNNQQYFVKSNAKGTTCSGWQCFIYANAVYNKLYNEWVGDSSAFSHSQIVIYGGDNTANYDMFSNADVKCGAYMRTTSNPNGYFNGNNGHSLIILSYDESSITSLEGNWDGKGHIAIISRTWDEFNRDLLVGKSRYISHVVQPTESYYRQNYGCKVGDIIKFGSYPQSLVKDESVIAELEQAGGEWISYEYMKGNGMSWTDGSASSSDFMKYKDIELSSEKYRGVCFSKYRPYYVNYMSSNKTTIQTNNNYYTDTVYWFKYEPIQWIVIDPEKSLVISKGILDSQPFSDTVFFCQNECYKDSVCSILANDYRYSSIRKWLRNNFYNVAFSDKEKHFACGQQLEGYTEKEEVFLLSYEEAESSNIILNSVGSDYAACQGLLIGSSGSYWWLRTKNSYVNSSSELIKSGWDNSESYGVGLTSYGVRPATVLNNLVPHEHQFTDWVVTMNATCGVNGYREKFCPCGEKFTETIPATGNHNDSNNDGKCDACGKVINATKPDENKPTENKPAEKRTFFQKVGDFFKRIGDWFKKLFK